MNQLINLILFSSIYIVLIGLFFLGVRKLLNKIDCSQVIIYRLWIVFPIGLIVMLILPSFDFHTNIPTQLSVLKISTITVTQQSMQTVDLINWLDIVAYVWALLAVFNLLKLLINYLKFKKLLALSSSMDINGIYKSDEINSPLAFGLFKSHVYIPTNISQNENCQLLIKHEQIHCKRKDPLIRIVYKLISSVFWFHPMIHIINKIMIIDQETSCDELVLSNGNHAVTYSKLLLKFNQSHFKHNHQLPGYYCSSISMLKERIMLINKLKLNRNKSISYAIFFFAIIGLAITTTTLAEISSNNSEVVFPKTISTTTPISEETTTQTDLIQPNIKKKISEVDLPKPTSPPTPSVSPVVLLPANVELQASTNDFPQPVSKKAPAAHSAISKHQASISGANTLITEEGIEIELIKTVAPHFPRRAAKDKVSGYVNLELSINNNGTIENVRVLESVPTGVFDKEAIKSVKQYVFGPVSQPVTLQQKIKFVIE